MNFETTLSHTFTFTEARERSGCESGIYLKSEAIDGDDGGFESESRLQALAAEGMRRWAAAYCGDEVLDTGAGAQFSGGGLEPWPCRTF